MNRWKKQDSLLATVPSLLVLACGGEVEEDRSYIGVPDFSNAPCEVDGSCKEETLAAGGEPGVVTIEGDPEGIYELLPWNAPEALGPAFEKITGMRAVTSAEGVVAAVVWVGWDSGQPEQWMSARRDGEWKEPRLLGKTDPLDAHTFPVALLPNLDVTGRRVLRLGPDEANIEPFHWAWFGLSYPDNWEASSDGEAGTYFVELLSGSGPEILEVRGEQHMGALVWRTRYFDGSAWQVKLDVLPESGISSVAGQLDGEGTVQLVWQETDTKDLFVKRWDPLGTKTTEASLLAQSADWYVTASSREGAAVVVWSQDDGLMIERRNPDEDWGFGSPVSFEADVVVADWCPSEDLATVWRGEHLTRSSVDNHATQPLLVLDAGPPALGCTSDNLIITANIADGRLNIFETRPGDILEGTEATLMYPAHDDRTTPPALAVDDDGHAVLAWPGDTPEGVRLFVANRE